MNDLMSLINLIVRNFLLFAHLLEATSIVCISSWFTEYCARYLQIEKKEKMKIRWLIV